MDRTKNTNIPERAQMGAQTGTQAGTQIGVQAGAQTGTQAEAQMGAQAGSQPAGAGANTERCDVRTTGILPACGMLATSYVPVQRSTEDSYDADQAIARGTLFPGLDLPYLGMVNENMELSTPLKELMALGFVVHELGLYLDTHRCDQEALEMFQRYNKLYSEGVAEYERRYGPLQMTSSGCPAFDWVDDPWPWDVSSPQPRENALPARLKED